MQDGDLPAHRCGSLLKEAFTAGTPVHLQWAGKDDLNTVLDILEDARQWLLSRGITEQWPAPMPPAVFAERIARGEVYLAYLDEGAEAAGTFCLLRSDDRVWGDLPGDAAYVHGLAVRRTCAGRNIGAALLNSAGRIAAEMGLPALRLDCWAGNADLCRYYDRLGFERRGQKHLGAGFTVQRYERALAPLGHRLIMLTGTSGAGKSTLSRWLRAQLGQRTVPAILLPEDEVYRLDVLQPFTEGYDRADPSDIRLLLDDVRSLVSTWHASRSVWITDAFLPAVHWLFGKYPDDHVRAYAEELAAIVAPLHPLLVSVEADVRIAWERAVDQRGQNWSDRMVDIFSRRNLPLYPPGPIRDVDDLLGFFAWVQSQSSALLARWPGETLLFDTTTTPLDAVEETLLRRIDGSASAVVGHNLSDTT